MARLGRGQPFKPLIIPFNLFPLGPITGTLATTNADDTSAASGNLEQKGTLATTNADDTSAASGIAGGAEVGGHSGYDYGYPKKKKKKKNEIREEILAQIMGEQEEILDAKVPEEIKKEANKIAGPYTKRFPLAEFDIESMRLALVQLKAITGIIEAQRLDELQMKIEEEEIISMIEEGII